MKTHKCEGDCPKCGESLALTTEWGWIDDDTCTAILCCPSCRTECGWSEAAVVGHDAESEEDALAGVSVDDLLSQMRDHRGEEEDWYEDDE